MTQAPAVPDALAGVSTDQLMFDLLRRANLALADFKSGEAERLFRAVLAYRPGDGQILQVLGEIALANGDWAEARECARRSFGTAVPPSVFIRSCAIYCSAVWMTDGAAGVRVGYDNLRDKLTQAMDTVIARGMVAEINLGITAALCADDHALAHAWFLRRFEQVLPPDVETKISRSAALKDWCVGHGAEFRVLDAPRHVTSAGLPSDHGAWDYTTVGVNAAVVPGGELLSGFDFVFAPTGEMLHDSGHISASTGTAWYPRVHGDPTDLVLHIWSQDVVDVAEPALFLSCSQSWHVGHFIVDLLPRLRGLDLRPGIKVAIPTETPKKHRHFLRLFGIDENRIVECDLRRRYRFPELVVVQTGNAVTPEPNNICFVADAMRTRPRPEKASQRIFLERDMKNRAVANREELDAELDRLDFVRHNLAALSVAEQRAALSAAEVVMTTYGSDLLAFYMMNEGAALIELTWDRVAMESGIQATCSMVGVDYYVLECAKAENAAHRYYKKDTDFIVDIAALRAILNRAGIAA